MLEVNSISVWVSKSIEAYIKKQLLPAPQNDVIIIFKNPNLFLIETQEIQFSYLVVAQ